MVMRVKASPALDPNGLEPPTPPNAPDRPPPLPRWISTRPIRNRPLTMTNRFRMLASHIASAPPGPWKPSAVNGKYTHPSDGEQADSRRPHDRQERVGPEAGPADQRPVHVRLAQQRRGVVRLDAAAVLD